MARVLLAEASHEEDREILLCGPEMSVRWRVTGASLQSGAMQGEERQSTVVDRLGGVSAAVAAVAEAGNDLLLEVVARNADPVNNLSLGDLLAHLARFDVVVITLRCSLQTAIGREASPPPELRGLAQRDYGNVP